MHTLAYKSVPGYMALLVQSHMGPRKERVTPPPCLRENLTPVYIEPGSFISACSYRSMQEYLRPQTQNAKETTAIIEEPEARSFAQRARARTHAHTPD